MPEALAFSIKSDFLAFGMLLWELGCHLALRCTSCWETGYRMLSPEGCPPPVYDLMRHCWEWESSNFDEVSTTPNSLLEAVEAAFHGDEAPSCIDSISVGPPNHLPPPISCNASRPLVPHHTPSFTATNGSVLLPE